MAEMSMIERVARAILADDYPADVGGEMENLWWDRHGDTYMRYARAAIKSMHEPTSQMKDAGLSPMAEWVDETAEPVWKRMIEAALME